MDLGRVGKLIFTVAKLAGEKAGVAALTLWFCLRDGATPARVKALILGDLVYFVSPIDAIPDLIPGVGFSDDLGLLAATALTIAAHIKPEHKEKARAAWDRIVGS